MDGMVWQLLGIFVGILAFGCGILVFLCAPARKSRAVVSRMNGIKFAHRGLYDNSRVPENSLAAFRKAVEAGYAVEMDVRLTKDGRVVVFHDDTLTRMCGISGRVADMTLKELESMRLLGTTETIPTFAEFLDTIQGKVPILIEFKTGIPGVEARSICEKVEVILQTYEGPYFIESFDYLVLEWFRKHHPEVVRGQLAMGLQCYVPAMGKVAAEMVSMRKRKMLTHLLYNYRGRPHFIAYRWQDVGFMVRLNQFLGARILCWTVTTRADGDHLLSRFDGIIFEKFLA